MGHGARSGGLGRAAGQALGHQLGVAVCLRRGGALPWPYCTRTVLPIRARPPAGPTRVLPLSLPLLHAVVRGSAAAILNRVAEEGGRPAKPKAAVATRFFRPERGPNRNRQSRSSLPRRTPAPEAREAVQAAEATPYRFATPTRQPLGPLSLLAAAAATPTHPATPRTLPPTLPSWRRSTLPAAARLGPPPYPKRGRPSRAHGRLPAWPCGALRASSSCLRGAAGALRGCGGAGSLSGAAPTWPAPCHPLLRAKCHNSHHRADSAAPLCVPPGRLPRGWPTWGRARSRSRVHVHTV